MLPIGRSNRALTCDAHAAQDTPNGGGGPLPPQKARAPPTPRAPRTHCRNRRCPPNGRHVAPYGVRGREFSVNRRRLAACRARRTCRSRNASQTASAADPWRRCRFHGRQQSRRTCIAPRLALVRVRTPPDSPSRRGPRASGSGSQITNAASRECARPSRPSRHRVRRCLPGENTPRSCGSLRPPVRPPRAGERARGEYDAPARDDGVQENTPRARRTSRSRNRRLSQRRLPMPQH